MAPQPGHSGSLDPTGRGLRGLPDLLYNQPTDTFLTTEQQGIGSTSTITPHHTGIQTDPNGQLNLPTMEVTAGPQLE
ncbi:UNVERIFIED_CONTAM: hypothetical protein FKN15_049660 [Acipenser sinensis]